EKLLDLVERDMDGGGDDVAGDLAAELDDVFAQIRLDCADAVLGEVVVDPALLGDQRLALVDGLRAGRAADIEDDAPRVLGRLGPVDMAAGPGDVCLVLLEIVAEIGQYMILKVARPVAERIE